MEEERNGCNNLTDNDIMSIVLEQPEERENQNNDEDESAPSYTWAEENLIDIS